MVNIAFEKKSSLFLSHLIVVLLTACEDFEPRNRRRPWNV